MAVPLFIVDEATLKTKLRLSAVPISAADTEAIIDEAILRARVRFYRELGVNRTNTIVALAFTETPTTEDEVIRALANTVEVKMVYCELLRLLPNTFMDASGDVDKRWNEEAPTRERGSSEMSDELRRCEGEIANGLQELADPDLGDCDIVQTFDGTPDTPFVFGSAPRVGLSLHPLPRRRTSSED